MDSHVAVEAGCPIRCRPSRQQARRLRLVIAGLGLLALLISIPPGNVFAQASSPWVLDELLVGMRGGVTGAQARAMLRGIGATVLNELPEINVHLIRVAPAALDAVAQTLSNHPQVEFVEHNFIAKGSAVPDDPKFGSQWHHPRISAPAGWDLSTGGTQPVIAIIDSGINPNHPDLAAKLLPGYNFIGSNTNTDDVLGHGTAVAGAAAAIANNQTGVAGVAWENPVMPLLVLNADDWATYSDIAAAITYAVDTGASVINISIGGTSSSSTMQSAVNYAWNRGAVIVASAMNDGTSSPRYPAALDNVIAAAATDSSDNRASFSNYGNWIDLAAPGVSILTTTRSGGYGYWSGTSFSSPIIAGLAALVFSANPKLSNAEVVQLMEQSSDDLGEPGFDVYFGHGRVNVLATLQAALNTTPPLDTSPPTVSVTSPSDGSDVSGTVVVSVSATDDQGVTKVDLYVNGSHFATDTTKPFSFAWDSTASGAGTHTLTAQAHDAAGNISEPDQVVVTLDTLPPTSPTDLSATLVRKKVQLSWTAAVDDVSVSHYAIWRNGSYLGETTGTTYTDGSVRSGTTYAYYAVAHDAAGNASDPSNTATVTVGGGGKDGGNNKGGGSNKGGGKK